MMSSLVWSVTISTIIDTMIYILAILFGLTVCVQSFLSEVTAGNIGHLRNGREPNAGAALFPTFPFIPLLFVVIAWILQMFTQWAIWIFVVSFLALSVFWAIGFAKLKAEFNRLVATQNKS